MHLHLYYRNKIAFYKKLERAFKEKGYNITNNITTREENSCS